MINFPLPVVAIFSALLNLVFWSMSGSLGTIFEAKLCACLGKHGYQLRQPDPLSLASFSLSKKEKKRFEFMNQW
ncbi:hypothetical protein ES288_A04G000900v1 [Gossypium darwinii]|uniref:Uncharacterized protein n=1 Tax=Gossypium darwinii TaxID=34276 RepID=A0A5D2GRU1_GOSDA|nr:hypothetical protein ES288_A04G000900v1 [Gossypium darwinii]